MGVTTSTRLAGPSEACRFPRRNNGLIRAATPTTHVHEAATAPASLRAAAGAPAGERVLRALGALGLLGVVATVFLLTAGLATAPSLLVPARSGGWPSWMAGPLEGLGVGISSGSFQTLMLIMCASYLLVLLGVRTLPARVLAAAMVAAYAILLLGPPLISQDVFGYLSFARLGALHGLNPYTHVAAEAPTDAVFRFIGWPFLHSPYGPLFTLASYATAPLGLAGGLWAFKAVAVVSSLGAVALIARAAGRCGHSRRWAAAFVGLNPVLLELAVGGAHNDTLILLLLAAALMLTAGSSPRFRGAAGVMVAGVAIKVTAGVMLPFLVLAPRQARERLAVAGSAALSLLVLATVGLVGFGAHALGFLSAVSEQQQLVATHSVPSETARLVGLSGVPTWWRQLFVGLFLLALAVALWRTARGTDWRVAAGWTTLALLLSTAWLLPWYAIWPLPLAAVSGDRRLRIATLVFCAYAVLIHLPLAGPLLSPKRTHGRPVAVVHRNGVYLTRFEIPDHTALDLRW
jgi:Glycosyltransferase family 87